MESRHRLFIAETKGGTFHKVFLTENGFETEGMTGDCLHLRINHPLILANSSIICEEAEAFAGRFRFQSQPVTKVVFNSTRKQKRNRT